MKKGDLLFVYGTLRKGASSDLSRDERAEYVGEDTIRGRLYALGSFPGVKYAGDSDSLVRGDVFRILDDELVKRLDVYEGYPDMYGQVTTETHDRRQVYVYTYNYETDEKDYIESGNWLEYRQNLQSNPATETPAG